MCSLTSERLNTMFELRKILFPVDFSERSIAAAPHVAAMAQRFNARVTVLHVMELPPPWYGDLASAQLEALVDLDELKRERQVMLDAWLPGAFGNLEVERLVWDGDPAHAITDLARDQNVDLIMMPTHGHGLFRRLLLGSVTAKVLHDAACPVWTDVHGERPVPPASFLSILCAVDLRPESVPSIQWAAGYAAFCATELVLMHAIPAIAGPSRPEEASFRRYLIDSAREYIAELQRQAGTRAKVCIDGGKIAESVRGAAMQHAAGLVVIGRGSIDETLGGLRTNAYSIIRESPCPVVRI